MNYGLPGSGTVCLYSLTVDNLVGGSALLEEIRQYFSRTGYTSIVTRPSATIEDLKEIPPDCSVFFFNTHTLYGRDDQKRIVSKAFESNTEDTPANRVTYAPEIKAGRIVTNCEWVEVDGRYIEKCKEGDKLWITPAFIQHYWRFCANSLVFIHSCYSFLDPILNLIIAPITGDSATSGCGATAYAGWTMGGIGDLPVRYFFDRLLGANLLGVIDSTEQRYKEHPPQRPFDLEHVLTDMGKQGLLEAWDRDDNCTTNLRVARNSAGDLGILAPSIEYVGIDETEKTVTLHGFFGRDQSKIRVFVQETLQVPAGLNGYELTRESSSDEKTIVCNGMPESGDGSAGYLVAVADYGSAGAAASNAVPITLWKGSLVYTQHLPGSDKAVVGQITAEVALRGDIHRSRKLPGEVPGARPCVMGMILDAALPASYTSGSSYTDPETGMSYTWHGNGPLRNDTTSPGGKVGVWGWHRHSIEPTHPKLFVNMYTAFEEAMVDITDKEGRKIVTNQTAPINAAYLANERYPRSVFLLDFLNGSLVWEAGGLYERNYDIPKKEIESPILYGFISGDQKILVGKLTWETMKAKFAPDEETPS